MNYFELFDHPIKLKVNKTEVRRKYLDLSKRNHPDYFINESGEEQKKALEVFSRLNHALKTLSNDDETIRYVLQLKGLMEDEEKYTLSPGFLMQMMEVNEEFADIEDSGDKKKQLLQQLKELEESIYEPVENILKNYDEGITTEKELLQVKDYYFKKKYINRLRHQFD